MKAPDGYVAASFSAAELKEHARLRKRWAVGRATKKEIERCIELDRRTNWLYAHGNKSREAP